ncbi:ATP-binding protein [Spirosoma soli]|uniref:histidine kinase n=1 Tax=Spirosoma soli TaxID=1770529 RepID=A0ABW5M9A3_9BACT
MMRLVYLLNILMMLVGVMEVSAQAIVFEGQSEDRVTVKEDAWQFRAGDSTAWASPTYDDRHWTHIKPSTDFDENPELWKAGRGWFRQTFRFRRLVSKDVTMTIHQFGQSEVYLDGRRLAVLKPTRYDSGGSQRIVALLPIRIADTNQHTLAVRYAFRRDPMIGAVIGKEPFRLSFDLASDAPLELQDAQHTGAGTEWLVIGIFSLLSLLHFLFYRANPTQPVHRVLSATMLAFALAFLMDQAEDFTGTLTTDSLRGAVAVFSISAAFALLLLAVYTYLGRRPGWLFWGLVGLLAGCAFYNVLIGELPDSLFLIPLGLVLIEYVRVSWLAKRRNPDRDARLPWNSLKVTFFALLATIPVAILFSLLAAMLKASYIIEWMTIPMILLSLVGLLSVPLGLSLSLVRDYARTYLSLRQKLDQVEQLSAQALIQEQEKQQLLARQNETLERQVAERTAELTKSLTELRQTQQQLIQQEKMASLGELTAGIAHEIQNPLNFVNNFADVSAELVVELKEERNKAENRDEELEIELLGDLEQNLQKISQHGNRAAGIVRGMLDHARVSSGQREATDINALVDEYLRLAYHGLRAKDKSFNAHLVTNFDSEAGIINVAPQDVGRVLLNLFNNAFYAVQERSVKEGATYKPTVSVRTQRLADAVAIVVSDNGSGVPDSVKEKIFQPFFTTKPTGQGTGLGLSLSYDIITKGHQGTLALETSGAAGTSFVVKLPA